MSRLWLLLALGCGAKEAEECADDFVRDASGSCVPTDPMTDDPAVDSADPDDDDSGVTPEADHGLEPLAAPRLLRRMSLDRRQSVPSALQPHTQQRLA